MHSLTSRSRFFDQAVQTNKLSSFRLIERASRIVTALVSQVVANEANFKKGGEASLDAQGFLFIKNLEELLRWVEVLVFEVIIQTDHHLFRSAVSSTRYRRS